MSTPNDLSMQTLNRVRLFIAALPREFGAELAEIGDFIRELNDCCLDRGLYFSLKKNGKTQTLNDCSLAFFLLGAVTESVESGDVSDRGTDRTGAGNDRVRELYQAARDSYSKTGKPRIVVYTKARPEQSHDEAELLLEQPGADTETFHSNYTHIDTVKLGILMQIKQLDIKGVDIRLEGGKALQGSDMLMPLDNVESLAGYESLQNLKHKQAELEDRFYAAMARHKEAPDDEAAYEEYRAASAERNMAIQEIRSIETQLYHMLEGMYEQTAQGKLSKRQSESYKLVERGLFCEARDVLDFYSIVSESRHDEEIAEQAAKRAQVHVNELMQLKDINAILNDWESVEECYREAMRLEETHGLSGDSGIDFVNYLRLQSRYEDAAEVGERLAGYFKKPKSVTTDREKAYLFSCLGLIYDGQQRIVEAEEMHLAALAIRRTLKDGDPDANLAAVALTQNNLGYLYSRTGRYSEASEAYGSAMDIFQKQVDLGLERYEEDLALLCLNYGDLLCKIEDPEKATGYLIKARSILTKLFEKAPAEVELYLSVACDGLGIAYIAQQRYDEAEESLNAALNISTDLAQVNPGTYEPRIAFTGRFLGKVYSKTKRYTEAEETFTKSVTLFKKYSDRDAVYEPELAHCYHDAGVFYKEINRLAEAESFLYSSVRLYEKYKESNPALAENAREVQKLIDSVRTAQLPPGDGIAQFTPEEQEVALLLTEGLSQREITRKLGVSAIEYSRRVSSIRKKVSGMAGADPVIEAVADEYGLTRREADVLAYLHRGAGNDIITAELYLSEETVRTHVRNVMKKLSIENRQDVARWLDNYANAN